MGGLSPGTCPPGGLDPHGPYSSRVHAHSSDACGAVGLRLPRGLRCRVGRPSQHQGVTAGRQRPRPVAPSPLLPLLLPLLLLLTELVHPTKAQPTCGIAANGAVCPAGDCCSAAGVCGRTETFCAAALGCQSNCWRCGDGVCRGADQVAGETCGTCPQDCGPCTVAAVSAATADMVRSACVDNGSYVLSFDVPHPRCASPRVSRPTSPAGPRTSSRNGPLATPCGFSRVHNKGAVSCVEHPVWTTRAARWRGARFVCGL